MVKLWIIAAVLFLIVEAITVGLVSIWFVFGSATALILAFFNVNPWVQIITFAVVSGGSFYFLFPLMKRKINTKTVATNTDRLIGMTGIVLEDINNSFGAGSVSIDGKIWTARSETGEPIERDTIVVGTKIEGAKLFVRPANDD